MAHPNGEVVRKLYDARRGRDERAIRSLLAPDVRWHDPYPPPFGGDFEGPDQVIGQLFAALENELDESGLELHDVVGGDQHVVALVHWWSVRGGRRMDGREIGVYHVENGQVCEVWFMTDDKAAADAFFSSEA